MADVTYKVEFEMTGEEEVNKEVTESVDKSILPKETPAKKGFIKDPGSKKAIMFGYSVYKIATSVGQAQRLNDMTLRGDNLAAKMSQEKKALVDKFVGTGFSFAMGIAVKGTLGWAFIARQALQLATEAVSISMENRQIMEQNRQEKYLNQFEQTRFVKNTTTEAIRW